MSKNGCAMAKRRIAHAPLKGAFLKDSIGCAVVQLHIPAHMHMHLWNPWFYWYVQLCACASL